MIRHNVLLVLAVSSLVVVAGCRNQSTPSTAPKDGKVDAKANDPAKTRPAVPLAKPSIFVSAEQCFKDMKDAEASKKYQGAIIEVQGRVHSLSMIPGDIVGLWAGPARGLDEQVWIKTVDKTPWEKVAIGQTIKAIGKAPETWTNPTLIEAVITDSPGLPAPISSEALAAENTRDHKAALKKYGNKALVVTGVVTKVDTGVNTKISLKDDGITKVSTRFQGDAMKFAQTIKVGSTIKINALVDGMHEQFIHLATPMLMK